MDDMTQRFVCLQREFDEYKKKTANETDVMVRLLERKTEDLQNVMEFALNAKRAEYDSLFMYNHKFFDKIHNSIKIEFTRFKEFPEITEKLSEFCEESKEAVARFVNEKKRVMSNYVKVAKEMRRTQKVLEMPVVNEIEAPDICVLYTSIIEMFMTILNSYESKEINAPEAGVNAECALLTSDVENFPDLESTSQSRQEFRNPVEQSPEETSLVPASVEVFEHQSVGPAEPSQVLQETGQSLENCAPSVSVSGNKSKKNLHQKLVVKLSAIFPELDETEIVNYKNEVHRSVSFNGKRLTQIVDIVKKFIVDQRRLKCITEVPSSEVDDKESCSSKATKRERESRIVNIADAEKQCTICLESGVTTRSMTKLGCGHSFHGDCIKDWMNKNHSCPNCRAFVLPYDEYPKLKEQF